MPLLLSRNSENQQVYMWEFSEGLEGFRAELGNSRVDKMLAETKLEKRAIEKLGQLTLLKIAGLDKYELYQDENRKPHLRKGPGISFSHTKNRVMLLVSEGSSFRKSLSFLAKPNSDDASTLRVFSKEKR